MSSIKELLARFNPKPTDLVSVDIGKTGISAVRMRKGKEEMTVTAVDYLPPVASNETVLDLPPRLKAKYVSLLASGADATVKLLSFPGAFKESSINNVIDSLGIEDLDNYRISYNLVVEGHGRSESRVLAAAIPEEQAQAVPALFPVGRPAPYSLEISGLAAMTAFLNGPATKYAETAVGAVDFGDDASTFVLFNKNALALVRRFDIGTNDIVQRVQDALGVDRETAQGIINDGAFDISQSVIDVMEPLVKQLIISRDFVERREDCHISKLFVSGGIVTSHDALDEMKSAMGLDVETWNPFEIEGVTVAPDAIPENIKGQEWRFTAAIGACLTTFEES